MSKRKQPDPMLEEARRLAAMPVRRRKEALDVHRRIADDARLTEATRAHARFVLDTLERLIDSIRETM